VIDCWLGYRRPNYLGHRKTDPELRHIPVTATFTLHEQAGWPLQRAP
jgi:hypothetical protein